MSNDFDFIAPWYDRLARMVFGNTLRDAQAYFLNNIPEGSRVLILGGGAGWIIGAVFEAQSNCEVVYLEASRKMIELAKGKLSDTIKHKVRFVHDTDRILPLEQTFQVVITPFFLDVFSEEELPDVMQRIYGSIENGAIWIHTDFQKGNWWQLLIIKAMYLFFRLVAGLSGRKLPNFVTHFDRIGMKCCNQKGFFRGMISTTVYIK